MHNNMEIELSAVCWLHISSAKKKIHLIDVHVDLNLDLCWYHIQFIFFLPPLFGFIHFHNLYP